MIFDGLYRAFEKLTAFLAIIAATLVLGMSLWITYDVVSRYLFDFASPWSFDLSEYALVWITFLAAPWVLLQDRHVRIELLTDLLPTKVQRIIGMLVCLVALLACAVLAWRTGIAALQYYERNTMMPRIWRIPRIWPYCVIPIGSFLLTIAFAFRFGLYCKAPDPEALLDEKAAAGQETGYEKTGIEKTGTTH